jgi:glycosyltransferase involved in cell wall biosynthesis
MRVLTITNLYPNPFHQHRATFNRTHLRLLGQRHPVRVISPIAWTDELRARLRGKPSLPEGRQLVLDGLEVEHPRFLFTPKILRGTHGRSYLVSVRSAFERAVEEFRPDILFAPWAYPDGWAAVELGRRAGIPVVVKVHGSDILLLDQHAGRTAPTSEALQWADAVVAVSEDLSRHVVELGADPSRVRVIYDGVDKDRFHPGPASEARTRLGLNFETPMVLSVGNLVPVKGQDVLIEACARLVGEGLRFTCCLIGGGPLQAALERQAASRQLGDRFRILGALPQATLPDWYRSADVFALPSHSEGVPNVLLEAAACGTPFVASKVGGIPEIEGVGPCRLVPPNDPVALAEALRAILEQPSSTHRAEETVRDVSETVEDLEQLFEDVLRMRARPTSVSSDLSRRPMLGLKEPS